MSNKIVVCLVIPLLCACAGGVPGRLERALVVTPTPVPSASATVVPPQNGDGYGDEQAVYAVFFAENPDISLLHQDAATDTSMQSPQEMVNFIKSGLPAVSDETINDYLANNAQDSQFSADMKLGVEYQLLSAAELTEISSQSDWGKVLQAKYPGTDGYMFFSRAGFNAAHDQALVYVGRVYGPLAAEASYYALEKKDGQWRIVGQINRVAA